MRDIEARLCIWHQRLLTRQQERPEQAQHQGLHREMRNHGNNTRIFAVAVSNSASQEGGDREFEDIAPAPAGTTAAVPNSAIFQGRNTQTIGEYIEQQLQECAGIRSSPDASGIFEHHRLSCTMVIRGAWPDCRPGIRAFSASAT